MRNSILFIFLLLVANVYSQSPDWSVNASSYQYNMTFTVFLNVNGTVLINANDKVGAFVNGENRGEATVVYNANAKKYVAYLTVLANTAAETISFKIYDSTNNTIINVPKTEVFEINKNLGGAFQSYSIANPTLNSQAKINSFSYQGIAIENTLITNNTVTIEVLSTVDITNLTPVFTTENNGKVYSNKTLQVSSNNTLDFSNDVVYEVLSEDESQKVLYTVKVKKIVNTNNQITFTDANFTFDGTEKSLTIGGTLPSGTSVAYTNNGLTNVGSKQVTATISGPSFQDVVLTANLTVTQATITGVTFSNASFTFDGSEKKITIVGAIPNGTTLNYVLNTRTNAGNQEAFAVITGDNYVNLVLKANLIVEKAIFGGFTFSDKSYIYDGTSKSILITENLPIETTVNFTNNNKTNAGVYEVVATISKDNYKDLVLKANLTITKLTLSGFSFEDENFIYDGKSKSILIAGDLPFETTISYSNNNLTDTGSYEVTATISGANYQDLILKANLTITKATLSGFVFDDESFVYDGTSKSLKISGDLPSDVSVSYSNNNLTDAGSYEVTATIFGANYKNLILKANLTITKATLSNFTFEDERFVYNGTSNSLKILESLPSGVSVSYSNNSFTNAGSYEVTATIFGANYTDKVLKATLTIVKATLNGLGLASENFVYDGTSKSLNISGDLPSGVSVSYSNNNLTDTGSYEVTSTISGINYEDLILKANLTITKASLNGFSFDDENFVYDGTSKSLNISGDLPSGVSVSYSSNSFTDTGSYEVTATISGINYENLILKANLTITKATLSNFTFEDERFVYSGTSNSLKILESLPSGVSVSYSNNSFTNTGSYEVTATIFGANYTDKVLKATLTIVKATLNGLGLASENFVYDGTSKSLNISGDLPSGVSVSYSNNSFTNTGSYEVTATIFGANYTDKVLKATLTIVKATLNGLGLASENFVYDGTSKSLNISGNLPSGVSVSYSNNSFTDAGSYEVTATISGANYQDLILKANLTITKATLSGFVFDDDSFVYDGTPKSLKISGNLPTGISVSYSHDIFTDAGSYEVTVTIYGPNYENLILKANLTITKATLSNFTFEDERFVYNGTSNSLKILESLPSGVSVSYSNNSFTDAGSYEVTATISGANYTDKVLKATLTIVKATLNGLGLASENFVYDGTSKSLNISGDLPSDVSVSYSNNNLTETGSYEVTATIYGPNYENLILKANLTITKATLSNFTFEDERFVYSGTSNSLKILESLPSGVSVSYSNNSFTNTGSYEVTATIFGANYTDKVLKATLTIVKATLNGLGLASENFVYDGTSKSLNISGNLPSGVSVSYSNNSFTDAGSYEVTATISGANYQDLILKANLTITKATLSGFVFDDESFVYDGTPKSLKISGNLPTGISVSYSHDIFTDAGSYEVTVTIYGPNYENLILKANLTITKATLSGFVFDDESFVYDGTPKSLKISGDLPSGVSVSYSNNSFTDAGTYEVKATISGINYEDLILKANLTITKASLSGFVFDDESFVYDGTSKSLKISGDLPSGVSVSYSSNSFTDTGSYEVTATISGSNYQDLILKANLIITKATLKNFTFNNEIFVYDGAPKSIKILECLPSGISVSYSSNSFTDAGTYEVTATISGANYTDKVLKATLTIVKATLNGLGLASENFVYDGTPKSLKISGNLPNGVSISYSSNSFIDAGSYEVTTTISGINHENLILKANLTITKASLNGFSFDDENFVYDGTPKSLNISGNLQSGVSVSYSSNSFIDAGSYEVTATISRINHENLILKANLTIAKAQQTITFNEIRFSSDQNEFNLEATSSAGLQIKYVSSNTNVAIVSDNLVFLVGKGVATITASQPGNNNFNAAINKSQEINISTLGAKNEIFEKKSILLYPNPVNSNLKLKLNSEQTEVVLIYDTTGKMVKMIKDYQSEKDIDVSNFTAGNYFIQLSDTNGLISVKSFIKN
ncbi:MBG domain-containing protein [Polaribacter sp. L3A8]|uniref:MBG domain-containing protein n=1 Tax=Polaribacter sp. L3A8 TaxID=2686361 RepID=UPI00131C6A94|nr:MBG domain-containing protein [Polaribacter sp. L3A8]